MRRRAWPAQLLAVAVALFALAARAAAPIEAVGAIGVTVADLDRSTAFYRDVLGFGLSDIFNFRPDPSAPPVRIHFFHCNNARHHSLAIAEYPVPSGCVHVMVEVDSMTEVGRAHDRRIAHKVPLSATLGQHLNDRMTSFYMKTPSGFDLEYGFGGLQCDWDTHSAFEFTRVSIWGHDFGVKEQAA